MLFLRNIKPTVLGQIKTIDDNNALTIPMTVISDFKALGGKNELSVFKSPDRNENNLNNAVAAFAAKGNDCCVKLVFVITDEELLKKKSVDSHIDPDLDNPYVDGVNLHYEIVIENVSKLHNYLCCIKESIDTDVLWDQNVISLKQNEVKNIIIERFKANKIDISKLNSSFKWKLLRICQTDNTVDIDDLKKSVIEDKKSRDNDFNSLINQSL